MAEQIKNQYLPDYISAPGETLLEALEERGMSQAELARRAGRPKKTINEIVKGKTAITPETALQLERVLGIPTRFWINRQQHYDQRQASLEEEQHLRRHLDWLKRFPVKAMIKFGWISKQSDEIAQMRELLNFFGIASPEQWRELRQTQAAFRKTAAYESDAAAIAAWLRKGELEAHNIHCQPYDASMFREILSEKIRPLTLEPPKTFLPEMVRNCAVAGVAVTFVPQLPKTRVSGATRWLTPYKALIQLSLRYGTADHLWFSFFHESGHILLHGKRDFFLEHEAGDETVKEREANKFACDILIPHDELKTFLNSLKPGGYPRTTDIRVFARHIGVAPGIVAGRLQHDGYVPYSHYHDLKQRITWESKFTVP